MKITDLMIAKQKATIEKNCQKCYMEENGICLYYNKPLEKDWRCGMYIEGNKKAAH